MKIIGVLPVYEEADWIEYAVKGIIDFVDVLIIAEGYQGPPWHFLGNRSRDGTLEILNKLEKQHPKIHRIKSAWGLHVNRGKARMHNKVLNLLKRINLFQENNWYFLVDSDEFYTEEQLRKIRKAITKTDKDFFYVYDRMFVYNFKYFIPAYHGRLYRITPSMRFKPAQFPCYVDGSDYVSRPEKVGYLLKDQPMFHYSFVRLPKKILKRIQMEFFAGAYKPEAFRWFREIFMRWSEDRAEEFYKKNQKITGVLGILHGGESLKLQKYNGPHSEILANHPYRFIDDIRKIKR